MTANYRAGMLALALATTGVTAAAAAQQPAHQGHETKPGQDHSKMSMPALDDAHFVEMMRKHHQGGIELSKVEESKGSRDDVKSLAARIRAGQERDLQELQSGHADHTTAGVAGGTKPQEMAGATGHDAGLQKHHEMMQQMATESKQKVENASGAAVDQAFLSEMTMHHQMALEMIAKAKLKNANLRKLSQKMAAEQKREIAEMRRLQAR